MALTRICNLDELADETHKGFEVGDFKVLLVRQGDEVFAYEDRCPHQSIKLSEGTLRGCVLTCMMHRWTYDAKTGQGIQPKNRKLKPYALQITEGAILVDLV